jgi:RimJ/RimL family protein N-acetyltransferase
VTKQPIGGSGSGRSGRWVRLVPLAPDHYEFVYGLLVEDPAAFHSLFPAGVPSRNAFGDRIDQAVLCCFVVVGTKSDRPLGVACLYQWSAQDQVAHVFVTMTGAARGTGMGIEAACLFVAYVFAAYNVRKLYVAAAGWQLAAVRSAVGGLLEEEGRLRDHRYRAGCWYDEHILSVRRDRFRARGGGVRGLRASRNGPAGEGAGRPSMSDGAGAPVRGESPRSRWIAPAPVVQRLESRRVRLVPVGPVHMSYLYGLATTDDVGSRWIFGGMVPTLQEFQRRFHHGVFAQFVPVLRRTDRPFGHLVAYQADLLNGHVYIGGVTEGRLHRTGYPIEAFMIFLRHLFLSWNFRKVYMDLPEFNRSQMFAGGLVDAVQEEARLRDFSYHDGEWWDRSIVSLRRTTFMEHVLL